MQRVFFSFHVPEAAASRLLSDLAGLPDIRLYPKENLHLTLQFVGEIAEEELEKLFTVGEVVAEHSSPVKFIPTKFITADNRLRLEISPSPALNSLRENIVTCLKKINLGKIDPRPYAPHITLGRPGPSFDLKNIVLDPGAYDLELSEFGLYKSEPGENKTGVYTLLKSFSLKK